MRSVLFLISIFSAFDLNISNDYLNSISDGVLFASRDSGIEVEFTTAPHLSVGDPVMFKGQLVGSVLKVNTIESDTNKEKLFSASTISIKITDLTLPLTDELVGLVAKVKVPSSTDSKPAVRSALELIAVNLIAVNSRPMTKTTEKTKLLGFGSFEEFWNSNSKLVPSS